MSNTKHTPGPWEYRQGGICPIATLPNYPPHIVRIYRDEKGRHCTSFIAMLESATEPNDANARLIAAAPELLEAVKDALLVTTWDQDGWEHTGYQTLKEQSDRREKAIEFLRASLEKAEGL